MKMEAEKVQNVLLAEAIKKAQLRRFDDTSVGGYRDGYGDEGYGDQSYGEGPVG